MALNIGSKIQVSSIVSFIDNELTVVDLTGNVVAYNVPSNGTISFNSDIDVEIVEGWR